MTRSLLTMVLLTATALGLTSCAASPDPVPDESTAVSIAAVTPKAGGWLRWRQGRLARVSVERALYEMDGEEHFLMCIRVENLTDLPIGVDLSDYDRVVYPNQWGAMDTPYRGMISEERIVAERIDFQQHARMLTAFSDGFLTRIEPRAAIHYFREFNASSPADVSACGLPFVFVSMDGQLLLTDGTLVESLHDDWVGGGPGEDGTGGGDIVLTMPVTFQRVAAGARVIAD